MIVQKVQPDEEGYMHIKNIDRPLTWGLLKGVPTFWYLQDPIGKAGTAKVKVIKDGATIGKELYPNYRVTLVNNETSEVFHVFEEEAPLLQSDQPFPMGGRK